MERWKPVRGHEATHFVSDEGRVEAGPRFDRAGRWRGAKMLSLSKTASGYVRVSIKGKAERVNRLVLAAFVGPPPNPDMHAAHKNGIKTDNRLANLEWKTCKENIADKRAHGTANVGVRNINAKLNPLLVKRIRSAYAKGATCYSLAKKHKVSIPTINAVVTRATWKHV